jgi:hypothetical protein
VATKGQFHHGRWPAWSVHISEMNSNGVLQTTWLPCHPGSKQQPAFAPSPETHLNDIMITDCTMTSCKMIYSPELSKISLENIAVSVTNRGLGRRGTTGSIPTGSFLLQCSSGYTVAGAF